MAEVLLYGAAGLTAWVLIGLLVLWAAFNYRELYRWPRVAAVTDAIIDFPIVYVVALLVFICAPLPIWLALFAAGRYWFRPSHP